MTGSSKIPLYGVKRQYNNLREEILHTTDEVYSSGRLLDGGYTSLFEQTIARRYTKRIHAISVNSGTQALVISLLSIKHTLDIAKYVLVPAISFAATSNAVKMAGLNPIYCEVDPITGLIDLDKITIPLSKVAVVLYVNLLGNIIDYNKLVVYTSFFTERSIPIIEDAAQSFGALYKNIPSGKLGKISCLSFDPTKNLNNYGSGGMILTDNLSIWQTVLNLKDNGKISDHAHYGTNSKMNEVDCAHMCLKLEHFDQWQDRRRKIAEYYNTNITHPGITLIPTNTNVVHAYSKYVIHTKNLTDRTALRDWLAKFNIESKFTYDYSYMFDQKFVDTSLSIPIYPELTDAEVEHIVNIINNF